MASKRKGFFRKSRGKMIKNRSWFGVTIDGSQPQATFTSQRILQPTDYIQGNLQASAKLEAIYWSIVLGPGALPGGDVNWAVFGLFTCDVDESTTNGAINDPSNALALTGERWLMNDAAIVLQGGGGENHRKGIVKQKVRLKDADIRFVTSNLDPAEDYDYYFSARLLVSY